MQEVSINKNIKLSEHFTLGELTKTSYITADGNIPSHKAIENLKNICENWLEDLRYSYNTLYGERIEGVRREGDEENTDIPIIISSGYRSFWISFRGSEQIVWRCKRFESSDGLCGGYQMLWPGAHDQDGGDSAGYRGRYEARFR